MTAADPRTGLHLALVGSRTSPNTQRVAIALAERGTLHERVDIDLGSKPAWFAALAPLGRVPLMRVRRRGAPVRVLFESVAIMEFLEEIHPGAGLHPADPVVRAEHRAWMLVAVEMQADIEKIIAAPETSALDRPLHAVRSRLMRLERRLSVGPFFDGAAFANVDAAFAPVLRQLFSLESAAPLGLIDGLPRLAGWTEAILSRPSVHEVIPEDHALGLLARLRASGSVLLNPAVDEAA